jgi:hypothetical protein
MENISAFKVALRKIENSQSENCAIGCIAVSDLGRGVGYKVYDALRSINRHQIQFGFAQHSGVSVPTILGDIPDVELYGRDVCDAYQHPRFGWFQAEFGGFDYVQRNPFIYQRPAEYCCGVAPILLRHRVTT